MLVQLPIRTFAEVALIGYGVRVYCPACHRQSEVDPSSPEIYDRAFFATRFRCRGVRHMGTAIGKMPCEALGHIHIVPPAADRVLPRQSMPYCTISCSTCVPYWEIDQARSDREPWPGLFGRAKDGIACPTCSKPLHASWTGHMHSGYGWMARLLEPLPSASWPMAYVTNVTFHIAGAVLADRTFRA